MLLSLKPFYKKWLFLQLRQVLIAACGVWFPEEGWNPRPLHWEHVVLAWSTREAPSL